MEGIPHRKECPCLNGPTSQKRHLVEGATLGWGSPDTGSYKDADGYSSQSENPLALACRSYQQIPQWKHPVAQLSISARNKVHQTSDGPGSFHSLSQFVMSCASVLSPCPHSIDSSLFPLPCPHLKNNPHHPCWRLLLSSSCTPTCVIPWQTHLFKRQLSHVASSKWPLSQSTKATDPAQSFQGPVSVVWVVSSLIRLLAWAFW